MRWCRSFSVSLIAQTLSARPWVALCVDLPQPLHGYQRIDLGRGQRRVAEELLHDPDVGAPVEQVGGERVAQGVGREVTGQPRPLCRGPQDRPGTLAGEAASPLVEEDRGRAPPLGGQRRPAPYEVRRERRGGIR